MKSRSRSVPPEIVRAFANLKLGEPDLKRLPSLDQVRKAFRDCVKGVHPDVSKKDESSAQQVASDYDLIVRFLDNPHGKASDN